jgi:pilus assembly protein CpaB
MNTQRVLILGAAALAAGAAALIVRGLLGGGSEPVKAAIAPPTTNEVLVAATDLRPGVQLTPNIVRWQTWPRSAVDSTFITREGSPDINHIVAGAVLRAPVVSGEPFTTAMIVHANSAGFMAAMLTPGMRAISIGVSTESGAGGFILPNDRVDVLVTTLISDTPRRYKARTLLNDVRVLAVDQTYAQDKDQKVVLAKTATLELTPPQAEVVERAQATGTLSLSLRALGDNTIQSKTVASTTTGSAQSDAAAVDVIRYNVAHAGEQRE